MWVFLQFVFLLTCSRFTTQRALDIFRYLDLLSLKRIFMTSKQNALLVNEIFCKSPSAVTAIFKGDCAQVLGLLRKLQSPPSIAIIMDSTHGKWRIDNLQKNLSSLPKGIQLLYTQCSSIQAACLSGKGGTRYFDETLSVEDEFSEFSVMLGSFPDAISTAFILRQEVVEEANGTLTDDVLRSAGFTDLDEDWKVFIIYSTDFNYCDTIVYELQRRYPSAAILGGLTTGHVAVGNTTTNSLQYSYEALAVLAMRGTVPLNVVVSRGVEAASVEYSIAKNDVICVEGDDSPHNFIQVKTLTDRATGMSCTPSSVVRGVITRLRAMDSPAMLMLGVRPTTEEAYYLIPSSPQPLLNNNLVMSAEKYMGLPSSMQFFALTPEACRANIHASLQMARLRFAQDKQIPMATLMLSCSGRGPDSNNIFQEDQVDAKAYVTEFPDVPMVGTYMGGEIGPHAGVGVTAETVLRTGLATVQGFTAVFGIFAVPAPRSTLDILRALECRGESISVAFHRMMAMAMDTTTTKIDE
eukprot:gene518-994_t